MDNKIKKEIRYTRYLIFGMWILNFIIGLVMFSDERLKEIVEGLPLNPFAMAFWVLPLIWLAYPLIIIKLNQLNGDTGKEKKRLGG